MGHGAEVDADRLWRSLQEMGAVGATSFGGVQRIALTSDDVAGRDLLRSWAGELGCECRTDAAGNLFIRRPGAVDGPAVAFGSHLDSQPDGGRFDGALGVLGGIEVMRALADAETVTRLPLELVVWTDEEGARFDVSCIGSSVWAGELASDAARALTDRDGVSFGDALIASGEAGDFVLGPPALDSYFELHIEQGPELERRGVQVGVVEGIFGIRWLELVLDGAQRHAGTTPMAARSDALRAAAEVILEVERIGNEHGEDGRATVCVIDAEPNAGSVIPGRVALMVDLRHSSGEVLDAMVLQLESVAAAVGSGVRAAPITELWVQPPVAFDRSCVDLVESAVRELGMTSTRMLSGAGHDAGYVAQGVPTAMIFVPCRDGVSHHPDEHCEPEQAAAGAAVLLEAVLRRAI